MCRKFTHIRFKLTISLNSDRHTENPLELFRFQNNFIDELDFKNQSLIVVAFDSYYSNPAIK